MIVPKLTIHKQKIFLPFSLYHYVIFYSLQYLPKQCWSAWKAIARNAVKTQEGVVAANLIGRNSEVTSSWACSLEGKKESEGQSKEGSQEKNCERREHWSISNSSRIRY